MVEFKPKYLREGRKYVSSQLDRISININKLYEDMDKILDDGGKESFQLYCAGGNALTQGFTVVGEELGHWEGMIATDCLRVFKYLEELKAKHDQFVELVNSIQDDCDFVFYKFMGYDIRDEKGGPEILEHFLAKRKNVFSTDVFLVSVISGIIATLILVGIDFAANCLSCQPQTFAHYYEWGLPILAAWLLACFFAEKSKKQLASLCTWKLKWKAFEISSFTKRLWRKHIKIWVAPLLFLIFWTSVMFVCMFISDHFQIT